VAQPGGGGEGFGERKGEFEVEEGGCQEDDEGSQGE